MPPRSTRGATRAPGSRAGAGGATRRATRPSATPRGGAPCTPKTRASRECARIASKPALERCRPASMRTKRPIRSRLAFRRSRLETPTTGKASPCAPPVPVWNWLQALGTPSPREAKNWHFDRIVWQTVWDFANVLFHILLSVLNFAKPKCRVPHSRTIRPRETVSPPPISSIGCHLARSEDTPSASPPENGCFSRVGDLGGSGRGRPSVRASAHTPPSTGHHGFFSRHPTSSLALTLSSSACRARSPTRTPVRTSRAARVAKRTIGC